MYLVLSFLLNFFLFHPLTFDFYIKFSHHSFNCFVFGFESFIDFFLISSSNISFLYQVVSSFSSLLLLVFLVLFLFEIIFQFHPIWFILFFYVKFGSHSFQIYIFSFLSFFVEFFFNFILSYFGWLRIWHYFFLFTFYVVIRPYDTCHKFWKLDRVGLNHF
jgi:hypothetical protein